MKQYKNLNWLAERAILAAKNVDVNGLNSKIQQVLSGDKQSCKISNRVFKFIEFLRHATGAVKWYTISH